MNEPAAPIESREQSAGPAALSAAFVLFALSCASTTYVGWQSATATCSRAWPTRCR